MNAAQFDALLQAAADGIDYDGLRVAHEKNGYRFATPDAGAAALSESELHRIAVVSPYVSNWYFHTRVVPDDPAARAFLRHLERADERPVVDRYEALTGGVTTEWRDLRIETTIDDDGYRRYDLERVGEGEAGLAERVRADALRDAVAPDADGRVTDPPTGWRLVDCDHEALLDAIETVAPGSVTEWYRSADSGEGFDD